MFIHINCKDNNLPTDNNGVSSMDKLCPTGHKVSPNNVEEKRAWTDYSNISSKH